MTAPTPDATPTPPAPARRSRFWVVWSPQGDTPTAKIANFGAARAIAGKLAAKFPTQDFYVLESVWAYEAEEHKIESPPES